MMTRVVSTDERILAISIDIEHVEDAVAEERRLHQELIKVESELTDRVVVVSERTGTRVRAAVAYDQTAAQVIHPNTDRVT